MKICKCGHPKDRHTGISGTVYGKDNLVRECTVGSKEQWGEPVDGCQCTGFRLRKRKYEIVRNSD